MRCKVVSAMSLADARALALQPKTGAAVGAHSVQYFQVVDADEREAGVILQRRALERLQYHKGDTVAACRSHLRDLYNWRVGTEQPWVNGDDATEYLDRIGCEDDRRLIGAVFRPRSGWEYVTTVPSRLKRRHGRRISCWKWAGE